MNGRVRPSPSGVLVHVRMDVGYRTVLMHMHMEVASLPAQQEPPRQNRDDDADEGFGTAPDGIRELQIKEYERYAEGTQSRGVTQSPEPAEQGRAARTVALPVEQEGRNRGEVIRIGGVTQPEQDGEQKVR
jgi:hypothetical protein